jgi:hypothetical protein
MHLNISQSLRFIVLNVRTPQDQSARLVCRLQYFNAPHRTLLLLPLLRASDFFF